MNAEKTNSTHEAPNSRNSLKTVALIGAASLTSFAIGTQMDSDPKPAPAHKTTFTEHVQNSTEIPYNPTSDTLVMDGIKVNPAKPDRATPAEAVLNSPSIEGYIAVNPDESSSLTTSAYSLPDAESYAVVERDVDGDGDTDAVAVPSK